MRIIYVMAPRMSVRRHFFWVQCVAVLSAASDALDSLMDRTLLREPHNEVRDNNLTLFGADVGDFMFTRTVDQSQAKAPTQLWHHSPNLIPIRLRSTLVMNGFSRWTCLIYLNPGTLAYSVCQDHRKIRMF